VIYNIKLLNFIETNTIVMAGKYKTPGVYIEEDLSRILPHIAQVETAIPVFIGYTEKAHKDGDSLVHKPTRIRSILEYNEYFGEGFKAKFGLLDPEPNDVRPLVTINGTDKVIDYAAHHRTLLYSSLKLFYANGGGNCYIVSVGTYNNQSSVPMHSDAFEKALEVLKSYNEPTMIVIPDAVNLDADAFYNLSRKSLKHCAETQNRFTILDIYNGFLDRNGGGAPYDVIMNFRNHIGFEHLSFGAAYYPWLHTSVISKSDITFDQFNMHLTDLATLLPEPTTTNLIQDYIESTNTSEDNKRLLHLELTAISPTYIIIIDAIHDHINLLPPSGALAGVYARVDNDRGVWKAPANVSLNSVIRPSVDISHSDQDDLNVDVSSGKSINAIRSFQGKGTLVWGARTLDGNSNEWRYINVKRSIMVIEKSIASTLETFIFEPNTDVTWNRIQQIIENYLTTLWRSGALAGSTPSEAFNVQIGLGKTMTATDILDGTLLVQVLVALARPAEFIVITFKQKMQDV